MDLGSALLSAEMALEFTESDTRVALSAAPFVEGLLAAVVLAGAGADLDTIAAEARDALAAKREHLGDPVADPVAPAPTAATASEEEASFEAVVHNPSGLHARPAALFVRAASRHDAEVDVIDLDNHIEGGGRPVSGRSLIALMALGVRPGTRVRVSARGPGARAAIAELQALLEDGFGEL